MGPRPLVQKELAIYGKAASLFDQVLPGLTGLWQVSGRNELTYKDRARLDLSAVRLRGWAWSESAGWINLDDAVFFVGLRCGADLNDDGFVNGADLAILLAAWGPCSGPCDADLDTDGQVGGTVDGGDLAILLASWGSCQ